MGQPHRVQLKRDRGWKMPENTVKVDRTTRFGNPFTEDRYGREPAVILFRRWLNGELGDAEIKERYPPVIATHLLSRRHGIRALIATLHGKNLACWCPHDGPCHADILLELAAAVEAGMPKAG
jgi:hypothetical protein